MHAPSGNNARGGMDVSKCPNCEEYTFEYLLGAPGYMAKCAMCKLETPYFRSIEALDRFMELVLSRGGK